MINFINFLIFTAEDGDPDNKNDRERKRALNSSVIQEAISEYTDDPTVIHNSNLLKDKARKKRKEIEE